MSNPEGTTTLAAQMQDLASEISLKPFLVEAGNADHARARSAAKMLCFELSFPLKRQSLAPKSPFQLTQRYSATPATEAVQSLEPAQQFVTSVAAAVRFKLKLDLYLARLSPQAPAVLAAVTAT